VFHVQHENRNPHADYHCQSICTGPAIASQITKNTQKDLPLIMKCPECGLDTPNDSSFCSHCGAALTAQARVHAPQNATAAPGEGVVSPASSMPVFPAPHANIPPETVLWDEPPSLRTALPLLLLVVIITVLLLVGAHFLKGSLGTAVWAGLSLVEIIIFALGLAAIVIITVVEFVRLRSVRYKLSTQRFFLTHGLVNKRTDEIELEKYKDIFVNQDFWDKIVGCGDIEVVTADVTNPTIKVIDVRDPIGKKEAIRNAARERKAVLGIMRREEV